MLCKQCKFFHSWIFVFSVIAITFGIFGCSIKLIADYDQTTFEEILKVGKKIDRFYGVLLDTPEENRKYSIYSDQYVEIESDIRSLVTRNQARPLNSESTRISESILKFWVKYKDAHKANNGYKNGLAELDRGRFVRLFNAATSAEQAKNLTPEEKGQTPGK